jgi:hypothetical protein
MGLLVNVQVPPVGNPELHDSETLLGTLPLGVAVAVNVAGTPAATLALGGETASAKSLTATVALAEELKLEPATVTVPLLPSDPPLVGVNFTVTVAVAAVASDGIEQVRVDGVPLGVAHVPGLEVAEPKVTLLPGSTSVKVIPLVRSPLLVMV